MSEIQRYDIGRNFYDNDYELQESHVGDVVRFDDHQAKIDSLQAALTAVPAQEPVAEKATVWFNALSRIATLLEMPEDQPIIQAVDVLKSRLEHPTQEPDYNDIQLAEMIMSDCGLSTLNSESLVERIAGRIAKHTAKQPAQEPVWLLKSAQDLATHLWKKHYKAESPVFEVLGDLAGVLSQIDNMTTGLVRDQEPVKQEGWMPIEKAPKDGTKIIILCSHEESGNTEVVDAWFENSWQRIDYYRNTYWYMTGYKLLGWMPLPPVEVKE